MEDYKNGKILELKKEMVKVPAQTDYEINGIDTSRAIYFYRKEKEKFKIIPRGSYTIVDEASNKYLRITDSSLLSEALEFQVCYLFVKTSSSYIDDFPEIVLLQEHYNQLYEDFNNLLQQLQSNNILGDTLKMAYVLPQLDEGQVWVLRQGEMKAENIFDLDARLQEVLEQFKILFSKWVDDTEKPRIDVYVDEKIQIANDEINSKTELEKIELGNYTEQKKNELDIYLTGRKPIQYGTIAELQSSSNLKIDDFVEVAGYYTVGDGAGHYRVISNTDDGSGVQLSNGLWANIIHNGEVNVSWFGAKGDGIMDDTIFLEKAILYSQEVLFDTGVFSIQRTIEVNKNVVLTGSNESSSYNLDYNKGTVFKINNNISFNGCKPIIKNITFLMQSENSFIKILNSPNNIIKNCSFISENKNTYIGLILENSGLSNITECFFSNFLTKGLSLTESGDSQIINSYFNTNNSDNLVIGDYGIGLDINRSGNINLIGGKIEWNYIGVKITESCGVNISNVQFDYNSSSHVYMVQYEKLDTKKLSNINIIGNRFLGGRNVGNKAHIFCESYNETYLNVIGNTFNYSGSFAYDNSPSSVENPHLTQGFDTILKIRNLGNAESKFVYKLTGNQIFNGAKKMFELISENSNPLTENTLTVDDYQNYGLSEYIYSAGSVNKIFTIPVVENLKKFETIGYSEDVSGKVTQFGNETGGENILRVVFPLQFKTRPQVTVTREYGNSGAGQQEFCIGNITNTGFIIYKNNSADNTYYWSAQGVIQK